MEYRKIIYYKNVHVFKSGLLRKLGLGFLITWVEALFHYICLTNHPLVQIFYVFVAGGGFSYYVFYGLFVYFDDELIGSYHYYPGFCSAFFAYWSYYMACSTDPGKVTSQNTRQFQKEHKYDGILYEKNKMCKTCKVQKPARSKHCRVCNICVSKFDHHCIWIKQCVGQRNYKYFLMYLSSHAILTGYGWIAGFYILHGLVEKDKLWDK